MNCKRVAKSLFVLASVSALTLGSTLATAAPSVIRLTPPSELFTSGNPNPPIISRFIPGQRFDLQATINTEGRPLDPASVRFLVDGSEVGGSVAITGASKPGLQIATSRAYSNLIPGVHTLSIKATVSNASLSATGNFEIVPINPAGRRARNVIILLGDGMGIAHRTAARIMLNGVAQGKAKKPLAMDTFPNTALIETASLNSIVTDSAPGMQNYVTGNKSANNQEGVFPDDTVGTSSDGSLNFDNPRVEYMAEFLARTQGTALGIVTTADVFDATPASMAAHTQNRGNGTGIVDQYLDDRGLTNLTVLLGGGRKWFLPSGTAGSARTTGTDYVLPTDIVSAWGAAPGALDPSRDLLSDFTSAGFTYVPDRTSLNSVGTPGKLLGLFAYSNMNVALDKINGQRGSSTVVNDYGFPDQPMLDEMTAKALAVLNQNSNGFLLMVEGASIDKQAHNMDSERWILDTIEFDRAVQVAKDFAINNPDTLVIVTADHECAGANIIGGSLVTDAALQTRIATGGGATQVRNGVVGTYDAAGFPKYTIAADGYPVTTDIDYRMLIGYAANADRYEDWRTNLKPLRDSQQPFNNVAPLNAYPSGPLSRDITGNFLVTGQIADSVAAHTASDIPLSAFGVGAVQFAGVMDNTDVFFSIMQAVIGGAPCSVSHGDNSKFERQNDCPSR